MSSVGKNGDLNPGESQSSPSNSASETDQGSSSEPPSDDQSKSALGRALRDVAPYLDLGWRLAGTTAGPPGVGLLIDLWLQTTPWFLFGGCVVGLAGAVLQLRRL